MGNYFLDTQYVRPLITRRANKESFWYFFILIKQIIPTPTRCLSHLKISYYPLPSVNQKDKIFYSHHIDKNGVLVLNIFFNNPCLYGTFFTLSLKILGRGGEVARYSSHPLSLVYAPVPLMNLESTYL